MLSLFDSFHGLPLQLQLLLHKWAIGRVPIIQLLKCLHIGYQMRKDTKIMHRNIVNVNTAFV